MKKFLFLFIFVLFMCNTFATHIPGGEMIYEYIGPGSTPNTNKYKITLRLFRDQDADNHVPPGAPMPASVWISIFSNDNLQQFPGSGQHFDVPRNSIADVPVTPFPPCMTNAPDLAYKVGYFSFTVDLPVNQQGYTAAYNTCCRVHPMVNVDYPSSQGTGSTYICRTPGLINLPTGHNSSPQFDISVSAVCFQKAFTFNFHATDPDGDSLVYSFTQAYDRGNATSAANIDPPPPNASVPYYQTVPYINGFTAFNPLGNQASINSSTGIISGIAPPQFFSSSNEPERYVVAVLVKEFRNGVQIGEHRKDFIINVNNCDLASATLETQYKNCNDLTFSFTNRTGSTNILSYYWDFGDGNTSTAASPTYTYAAPGNYIVKLVVNRGLQCSDSATSPVKAFPGFNPDFEALGKCKNIPIQFNDLTTAAFGSINYWKWTFGEPTSPSNTAFVKNPTHSYTSANSYNVEFIVGTSVGCIDTLYKTIDILDKPPLSVLPKDTLICSIDTLQLNAIGVGSFLWTPNYMIIPVNVANPLVSPDVTTTYYVQITDAFGCTGTDSIRVRVVDKVTQFAGPDTTICKTDPVILQLTSDALRYVWTENPAGNTLNNPFIKNPTARPLVTTNYHVLSNIGKCIAEDDITVTPKPYPAANAGPDNTICVGNSVQLNASGGSIYSWSPAAFLTATNIANPVSVKPTDNIRYIVTVRDVLGCPKPARDTMFVFVAKIKASTGSTDTSVVLGQPLQLGASGSTNYSWTPTTWLDNPFIRNPIALPQDNITYTVRVSNNIGCFDDASIRVRLFRIKPDLLVPNAFTPNGDGTNDIFKPIPIGMKSVDIFRVYNRWGQMLYSGSGNEAGWDGTFAGKKQETAAYVWYAEGVDYLNNKIKRKGSVVLIR